MNLNGRARAACDDLQRVPPASATPCRVWLGALGLALIFGLLYQLGVPLRASYNSRVNVDEPFYLLTTVSLLRDGDLDLANDYQFRRYREFFDHPEELWYQSNPMSDGRLLSPHNIGLSVLVLPAYAVGGLDAAKAFLGLLGGVTVGLAGLLAYRATGRAKPSLLAAALVGISAPVFVYATQMYPELPAALLVTFGVWLLLAARPGTLTAVALALALSGLAWLGAKYVLVSSVVAAFALVRLQPRGRLVLGGLLVLSAVGYAWFHLATYGGLTPYSVNRLYEGASTPELIGLHLELGNRLYRLVGLWVDAEFGLVRWAPVLLLAIPALLPMLMRPGPTRWTWALVTGAQVVAAVFLSVTMRGWWFPGRMLVPVLPLLAIPLAVTLAALPRRPLASVVALTLAALTAATTAGLVLATGEGRVALAVDPFAMSWPWFQGLKPLFPNYTAYTAETWLLTGGWMVLFGGLLASSRFSPWWRRIGRGPAMPPRQVSVHPTP